MFSTFLWVIPICSEGLRTTELEDKGQSHCDIQNSSQPGPCPSLPVHLPPGCAHALCCIILTSLPSPRRVILSCLLPLLRPLPRIECFFSPLGFQRNVPYLSGFGSTSLSLVLLPPNQLKAASSQALGTLRALTSSRRSHLRVHPLHRTVHSGRLLNEGRRKELNKAKGMKLFFCFSELLDPCCLTPHQTLVEKTKLCLVLMNVMKL